AARRSAGDRRCVGPRGCARGRGDAAAGQARGRLVAAARRGARRMMRVVLRKELLELRRSPVLLLSMASLPLVVVAVPVLLLAWLVHAAPEQALASIKDLYDVHAPGGPVVAVGGILGVKWLPMFLVLPIFLPILVAAQSIGGERARRTPEPPRPRAATTPSITLSNHSPPEEPARALTR